MTFTQTAAEMARLLGAGYGFVVVDSFEEKRGLRLVQAASEKLGLPLSTWSVSRGMTPPAAGRSLGDALTALRGAARPGLLALLGLDFAGLTPVERRMLAEVATEGPASGQHLVALGPLGDFPPEFQREAAVVTLAPPDEGELRALLEEAIAEKHAEVVDREAAVAAARGLGLEEARRVFRMALLDQGDLTPTILGEKRRLLRHNSALDCIELSEEEMAGLSRVGGLENLKKWLVERKKSLSAEASAFGLPPPKGLLLLGVQGCGKSLSAKAIAAEWRMPLVRLDLAGLFTEHGSPQTALRRAIASVEAMAPVVLWLDEIEKGFSGVESGEDAILARLFGWFITWMGERSSSVFVVATANDVTHLPPELLRKGRFDETFFVDLPNEKARADILAIHVRRRGRDPQALPLASLAKRCDRFSGAEIEQTVIAALHVAFSQGRDLIADDLWNAFHYTVPLYQMYEEKIRALRVWAQDRARPASSDARLVDIGKQA